MTDIDIDKLEALERAATPAPWVYDDGLSRSFPRARPETVGPFGADAARTGDCIFLVELRNAAPALIAELRRLRAIEAAARDIAQVTEERDDPWVSVPITARQWDALKAALAAKEGGNGKA